MRKFIRLILALIACAILAYGTLNLTAYLKETAASTRLNDSLISSAVSDRTSLILGGSTLSDAPTSPTEETAIPKETAPISVDFDYLTETNPDIIGWLYSEDTPINLPVAQSKDNDYYLRRLIDGSWNSGGTLFADYRNARNFSDSNTVIYGHNMKNKEMFGTLEGYKQQSYYETHPTMWLLTPSGDYRLELVAGIVASTRSPFYSSDLPEAEVLSLVRQAIADSTFQSDPTAPAEGDRYLTLSTCSYEYDDARYLIVTRLHPLE